MTASKLMLPRSSNGNVMASHSFDMAAHALLQSWLRRSIRRRHWVPVYKHRRWMARIAVAGIEKAASDWLQ
jgi:hypothetical protein